MFLNEFQSPSAFGIMRDHGISCDKSAIEAELSYMPHGEASDVSVHWSGTFIVLEGTVMSGAAADKVVRVARDIAGPDRVISQLVVISSLPPITHLS